MIEWLRRVDPERPFLYYEDDVFTYGQTLDRVLSVGVGGGGRRNRTLDPDSVFDAIAEVAGGRLLVETSGTTGDPKEIELTAQNLEAAARASAEHLGHGPDDNWLLAMPLTHVGGLSIVIRQAYTGGSITMLSAFEPAEFAAAMNGRVTMVSVVPTMLRRLLEFRPFRGLRSVLVGGGPIPDGLLEEADAAGIPVRPTYGMTETFGQVATLRPDAPLQRAVNPLPGVEVSIGRDGAIALRGPQVSAKAAGADGWLVTNDVGEWVSDGAFRVLGRRDNVIITGGVNVHPELIEAKLDQHVDEVAVLGVPDDEWGEMVVCVYAGEVDLEPVAASVLSGAQRPKRYVRVDRIPRTALGKPDRSALERLL